MGILLVLFQLKLKWKKDKKFQNKILFIGQNLLLRIFFLFNRGRTIIIMYDMSNAITPPNLLGIARKIE